MRKNDICYLSKLILPYFISRPYRHYSLKVPPHPSLGPGLALLIPWGGGKASDVEEEC
jgi:hypothetical protein